MSGYVKPASIQKASAAPESKSLRIRVIETADIVYTPPKDANGVMMVGNFQLAPGKYWTEFDVTPSKTNLPFSSEGEEDNVSLSSLPEFYAPGSTLEQEEFVQNWTNTSIVIAVEVGACNSPNPFWRIYGSKCAPLTLLAEGQNDNEATAIMLKFQQFTKTQNMAGRYTGTFTLSTANAVPADTTNVDVAAGTGEYQLVDNTIATAIADLINAVLGGTYTLIGSGGTNPATIASSSANFFLVGAVDWTAATGATITFKAFDAGGGDFFFVEQSRTS